MPNNSINWWIYIHGISSRRPNQCKKRKADRIRRSNGK